MNIKDRIIQDFNNSVEELKSSFVNKLKKLFEEEQKGKTDDEKSSENKNVDLQVKRKASPTRWKLKKHKKVEVKAKNEENEPVLKNFEQKESSSDSHHEVDPKTPAIDKNKPGLSDKKSPSVEKTLDPAVLPTKTLATIEKNPESLKNVIKQLKTCEKSLAVEIINKLHIFLQNDRDKEFLNILGEIKAGTRIKNLISSESDLEIKKLYEEFIHELTKLAKPIEKLGTKWTLLSKQVNNMSRSWGNKDIQVKASGIIRLLKSKVPKLANGEPKKAHIEDRLGELIPGIGNSTKR